MNGDLLRYWPLDPQVTYLNHGAYGACPWPVLRAQDELRARMEREPVYFMEARLEPLLDAARASLGQLIGADPDDLAFVANATTGVNTVIQSLDLQPGDEILTTEQEYNACLNAIRRSGAQRDARAVFAEVPFPLESPREVVEAILACATERTRLAVISHVTSPTGLVFPVAEIVAALAERGIDTLVDGAHAPGMLPLDLRALGAAYYTGNAHKWLCAPKGSAFLHVRRDRQAAIRPLVTSHGANSPRRDRSAFRLEMDWGGTADPTPFLTIPAALDFMGGLLPGGWSELMATNRSLALAGRAMLLEALGSEPTPAPDSMIGSLAAVVLPASLEPPTPDPEPGVPRDATYPPDPLHDLLFGQHHIEVPVYPWPHAPADSATARQRLLRVSAQAYNSIEDYQRLAEVLRGYLS